MVENVIVVVVDALRADRVGAISDGPSLTPNIDSLASDGTVFERAYTCSPNTDPSLTAMMTGRYPLNTVYHHGKFVTDEEKRRVESVTSLPELLSERGLRTVATGQRLGRWHQRGFDRYPDVERESSVRERITRGAFGLYRRVDDIAPPIGALVRRLYWSTADSRMDALVEQDFPATEVLNHVDGGPFFGLVHLMDTHMPYLVEESDVEDLLADRSYEHGELEEFRDDRDLTDAQLRRLEGYLDHIGTTSLDRAVAHYDAAVRSADRKVGNLVSTLREQDLWEETTLFVTSDHGESLLGHGIFFDHHGLFEDVFRVPLVTDRSATGGSHATEFVQEIDLAPTILDLLDVAGGERMDGRSLRPLIEGTGEWDARPVVFGEEAYTRRRTVMRNERWKYVRHVDDEVLEAERGSSFQCAYCDTPHGDAEQLYDLDTDPEETENVVEEYPDVVAELDAAYQEFVQGLADFAEDPSTVRYDDEAEILDRLESLGYK